MEDKNNHIVSFLSQKKQKGKITCRTHCALFNDELGSCIAFKGLNYDDPAIPKKCLDFTNYHELSKYYDEDSSETYKFEDLTDFNELTDLIEGITESTSYPLQPNYNYATVIDGLKWYVAPDKSFGCWIYNQSKRPIPVYSYNKSIAIKDKKYRSLYPLHNHHASENLVSRMVWHIDEEGYGKYSVIVDDQIQEFEE